VLDGGRPRNAPASDAHGVFTRDGTPPLRLLDEAREQLRDYPDVEFRLDEAVSAGGRKGRFTLQLANDELLESRRLLMACGVRDELPSIPGLAELWGTRIHPCTYCHGYEVRDRPLAVLAEGDAALGSIASVLNLSRQLVLCTNGSVLDAVDRDRLQAHAVRIIDLPLAQVDRVGDGIMLQFVDGSTLLQTALFLKSRPVLASDLPCQLGCSLDGAARVVVGANWETNIPGVFAAGDIAADKKFVAVAAASGAEAAVAIDGDLAQEDFGGEWSGPLCTASRPNVELEPSTLR
jgi:thioredoxin reductase